MLYDQTMEIEYRGRQKANGGGRRGMKIERFNGVLRYLNELASPFF